MMANSGIVAWAIAVVWLLGYEWWAVETGHQTLSRAIYVVSQAWEPFQGLLMFVLGGLFVHFYWHWDPKDPTDHRG